MTVPEASPPDLADLVAGLRRVQRSGRTRPLRWRLDQLRGLRAMLGEQDRAIGRALADDLGRPAMDAWLADVATTRVEVRHALRHLRGWMRPQPVAVPPTQWPARAWVQSEPLGVVLVISPWNYPLYLALAPAVAALAAGNCLVLKPSELAPATSALLAELVWRYLDPDAVTVVQGGAGVTRDLLALGFDHVLFTGGGEVARQVLAEAAATLTPVTLELGGKSPALVAADADAAVTARRIAFGKVFNSGQSCVAPDYVLVERPLRDALVAELATALAAMAGGGRGVRLGNARHFDRLTGALGATRGRVVAGGGFDRPDLRMEPTLVVDPDPTEPLMVGEILGPILPVLAVDSLDEAVDFVNARPVPLALYVFTASDAAARRLIDGTRSGVAVVNQTLLQMVVPGLPFGGVGASGSGAYHGRWGFDTFSHRRGVLKRTLRPDVRLFYPPYGRASGALLRRFA